MGSRGQREGAGGREADRDGGNSEEKPAAEKSESVTAQHEGGRGEAWGGRGLSRPLGDRGVRGGLRAGGP